MLWKYTLCGASEPEKENTKYIKKTFYGLNDLKRLYWLLESEIVINSFGTNLEA